MVNYRNWTVLLCSCNKVMRSFVRHKMCILCRVHFALYGVQFRKCDTCSWGVVLREADGVCLCFQFTYFTTDPVGFCG